MNFRDEVQFESTVFLIPPKSIRFTSQSFWCSNMSVNIAHLVNRSGQNQSALSRVERYFRAVSERFKARIVNRSTKDIPVRVADIDILTLGEVFANPEFREGTIFTQLMVQRNESGYLFMQVVLFNKAGQHFIGWCDGVSRSLCVRP